MGYLPPTYVGGPHYPHVKSCSRAAPVSSFAAIPESWSSEVGGGVKSHSLKSHSIKAGDPLSPPPRRQMHEILTQNDLVRPRGKKQGRPAKSSTTIPLGCWETRRACRGAEHKVQFVPRLVAKVPANRHSRFARKCFSWQRHPPSE